LATHSLFLLRELDILGHQKEFQDAARRFFSLSNTEQGVLVQQSDSIDDIEPIVMLDENLQQSDRFLEEA
jgi:hypothetical protein